MIGGFPPPQGTPEERRLLKLFKKLEQTDQQTLLKFAEFLLHQKAADCSETGQELSAQTNQQQPELIPIERPGQETVVKAIKRLSKTYHMVDKDTLLHQTSELMTDHLIRGRSADEVIDDLEEMFASAYRQLKAED